MNLEKTIDSEELTDITLVLEEDQLIPAHSLTLATHSSIQSQEEGNGFPCDKCDKVFPNENKAKDLHMQKEHNIKTLHSTPYPVKRNAGIIEKDTRTRPVTKCTWCSYICQSKPSMNKHIELFHKDKKDKGVTPKQPPMKRQLTSHTCPICNSTFDYKYRMKNHMKSEHEGKHTLSPKRKVAKQVQDDQCTEEEKTVEDGTITIHREEIENLQDLLLQTGKDKEDLTKKVIEDQQKMQNLEKKNSKLEQENKYLKAENEKSNKHIQEVDLDYHHQVQDMTKKDNEKDNVIKILKDQLFRRGGSHL